MNELGWVLIFIASFGLSEFFVKIFLKDQIVIFLYYSLIILIGFWIIYKANNNKYFKNLKYKKTKEEDNSDNNMNNNEHAYFHAKI